MGELGGSDSRSRLGGGPVFSLDTLLSDASDEHDLVSDDLRSLPLKKSFILLLFSSTTSASGGSTITPPSSPNPWDPDRAAYRPGTMAEDDSTSPLFLPVTRSFSLPKAERGLSFMVRSNMLAVMLLRVNWTVTWSSPRSFSFLPALELSLNHLEPQKKSRQSILHYCFKHIQYFIDMLWVYCHLFVAWITCCMCSLDNKKNIDFLLAVRSTYCIIRLEIPLRGSCSKIFNNKLFLNGPQSRISQPKLHRAAIRTVRRFNQWDLLSAPALLNPLSGPEKVFAEPKLTAGIHWAWRGRRGRDESQMCCFTLSCSSVFVVEMFRLSLPSHLQLDWGLQINKEWEPHCK